MSAKEYFKKLEKRTQCLECKKVEEIKVKSPITIDNIDPRKPVIGIKPFVGEGIDITDEPSRVFFKNTVKGIDYLVPGDNITFTDSETEPGKVIISSTGGEGNSDNTEAIQNLQEVTDVGNETTNDIILYKEGEDKLKLGYESYNNNTYFTTNPLLFTDNNINYGNVQIGDNAIGSATKAMQNVAIGSKALANVDKSYYNIAIGYNALYNLKNDKENENGHPIENSVTVVGSSGAYNLTNASSLVAIGSGTMTLVKKMYSSVIIGTYSLKSLNWDNGIAKSDLETMSPVLTNVFIGQKSIAGQDYYGIDPNSPDENYKFEMGNNVLVGNIAPTPNNGPTRMVGNVMLGNIQLWNTFYRCFNNIFIGNNMYSSRNRQNQFANSLFIGNNLNMNANNGHVNGFLCIHNDKDNFTNVRDGLLTGSFVDRWFKLNGQLILNKDRTANAESDSSFTYNLVMKPDGTVGYEPKQEPVASNTYNYDIDYTVPENIQVTVNPFNVSQSQLEIGNDIKDVLEQIRNTASNRFQPIQFKGFSAYGESTVDKLIDTSTPGRLSFLRSNSTQVPGLASNIAGKIINGTSIETFLPDENFLIRFSTDRSYHIKHGNYSFGFSPDLNNSTPSYYKLSAHIRRYGLSGLINAQSQDNSIPMFVTIVKKDSQMFMLVNYVTINGVQKTEVTMLDTSQFLVPLRLCFAWNYYDSFDYIPNISGVQFVKF